MHGFAIPCSASLSYRPLQTCDVLPANTQAAAPSAGSPNQIRQKQAAGAKRGSVLPGKETSEEVHIPPAILPQVLMGTNR